MYKETIATTSADMAGELNTYIAATGLCMSGACHLKPELHVQLGDQCFKPSWVETVSKCIMEIQDGPWRLHSVSVVEKRRDLIHDGESAGV